MISGSSSSTERNRRLHSISDLIQQAAVAIPGFVGRHQAWAAPICFALAFSESLAFVSLIVPGSLILVGLGALVGASELSFAQVWAGASLGAAAGDWLSYWIGRRFGPRVASAWPLSRYPALLPRGQRFVERWGVAGIALGRFFGPLRAVIPLVAGICAMPFLHFQIANLSSAIVWGFLVLAPGTFGARWFPTWLN